MKNRKSIRLKNWDYTQEGYYFITICAYQKKCVFSRIENDSIILNEWGRIIQHCLLNVPEHFKHVQMDSFIIMPNHIHFILIIGSTCRGTACRAPTVEKFGIPITGSLPTVIRSFKSAVTKQIKELHHSPDLIIWQRNYYDHIIRNEQSLNEIRTYINNNPSQWSMDKYNL